MDLIYSTERTSALHLACEEILLKASGEFLFVYINEPSVILGANQNWEFEVNKEFCVLNDIQIRRRISGGGTVYHDPGNINYCFIGNKTDNSLSDAFLDPIIEALKSFHFNIEKGTRKDLWIQFRKRNYKISGTASHISKNRRLQHGTLLCKSNLDYLINSTRVNKIGKTSVPSVRSEVLNLFDTFDKNMEYQMEEFYFELIYRLKDILKIKTIYNLQTYIQTYQYQFTEIDKIIEKHQSPEHIFRR